MTYQIPGGYRGWAGVRYDDPTCQPLKMEGWVLIVPINSNGIGCTSDGVLYGWQIARYEYVFPDGRRQELNWREQVWASSTSGPTKPRIKTFFVGSQVELDRLWPEVTEFRKRVETASSPR